MNANWNYPTAIRTGAGRVGEIVDICRDLKMNAPLLVTDPGLAGLPMVTDLVTHCGAAGLSIALRKKLSVLNGLGFSFLAAIIQSGIIFILFLLPGK